MPKSKNLTHLRRALAGASEDQMTCAACEGDLPDYAQAVVDGHHMATAWQAISRHIESCPHCSQEVELLVAMLHNLYEELPDEPVLPTLEPDLTFLQPTPVPSTPWWRDALGQVVIALAAVLDTGWQSTLQPASSGLKSDVASQRTAMLTVPDHENGYTVQVQITHANGTPTDNANHGTVTVHVTAPGRDPLSLDGLAVTLSQDGQRLDQQWTDALGVAIFTAIPITRLPHLVLTLGLPVAD